jgi:maltooligosyltrehalose trehalohydrolase
MPALRCLSKDKMDVISLEEDRVLAVRRWNGASEALVIFNFSDRQISHFHSIPYGVWHKRFDSSDRCWMGEGTTVPDVIETPHDGITLQRYGVLLYEKEIED